MQQRLPVVPATIATMWPCGICCYHLATKVLHLELLSSDDKGLGLSVCMCVRPVSPHRWADRCVQVQLSSITLHSLSVRVQALSLDGCPQRLPMRAQEQQDGRKALLSAGLMPTKVQHCRHNMAQAGLSQCVCKSVPSSLRCQAWWVKINPISFLTSNPTLKFLLCQLCSWKKHVSGPKQEPWTFQYLSEGSRLWLVEQMWCHITTRTTTTNKTTITTILKQHLCGRGQQLPKKKTFYSHVSNCEAVLRLETTTVSLLFVTLFSLCVVVVFYVC